MDFLIHRFSSLNDSITNVYLYHSKIEHTTSIHGYILHGNYSLQANASKYGEMGVSICVYDAGNLIECTETSFIIEDGETKKGYFAFDDVGYDRNIEFKYSKKLFKDGSTTEYIDIMTQQNPLIFYIHEGGFTDFLDSLEDGFTIEHFYVLMRYVGLPLLFLLFLKIVWEALKGNGNGGDEQKIKYFGRGNNNSGWGLN